MKKKNHLCQKLDAPFLIPAEVTASVVGCSTSFVKQVRQGRRNATTGKGAKIALADDLMVTGANALIEEVKRIVKL